MALVLPAYVYDSGGGPVTINFTQPLEMDDHPILDVERKDVFGGTGIRQSNVQYIEEIITLSHQFEAESVIDSVDTMMETWVLLGNTFDFLPDQTVTGVFDTVELIDKKFSPKRMVTGRDLWEFKIKVRKQIT